MGRAGDAVLLVLLWLPRGGGAQWVDGEGDAAYIEALNKAYRMYTTDPEFQSIGMLYSGSDNGLHEGPTWGAWWTQNSYGTQMSSYPFLPDTLLYMSRQSQSWFFNNMANGSSPYASGTQGWAPDGCMCDDAGPGHCNYKQGDGNVPLHDWTVEETLSALVMQAEMLLVTRNLSELAFYSPLFLRTSNFVESRRDAATGMTLFLTGPSSNLLAPSFGGWPLDNGHHAWSYLTGVSVTYTAALNRMIECEYLLGNEHLVKLYTQRRDLNLKGLSGLLDPTGKYFVRSKDPNGTLHGVIGQARHGYFEASPNHDAVAFRVVDDNVAQSIFSTVDSLGSQLRPNVFMLPNTDTLGRAPGDPSAVGYDDMVCGNGKTCGGIFEWGTWVNGGVWTTTEARAVLAYLRLNRTTEALHSVQQMIDRFASVWRMDNPLTHFGLEPYQPSELINQCVDNYGNLAAFIRGQFEYLYTADTLTLIPHIPDNVTALKQRFAIRWGAYRIQLNTRGVRSSGIAAVSINGSSLTSFNASTVTLTYTSLPPATSSATQAINSSFSTTATTLIMTITFRIQQIAVQQKVNEKHIQGAPFPTPAVWLQANLLNNIKDGDPVKTWPNLRGSAGAAADAITFAPDSSWVSPTFVVDAFGPGAHAVRFSGVNSSLTGTLALGPAKTILAVFRDTGSTGTCCNDVISMWNDTMDINGLGTKVLSPGITVLEIDWAGSGDSGTTNVNGNKILATLVYESSGSYLRLGSALCDESNEAATGTRTSEFSIGSRRNGDGPYTRFFKGDVGEVLIFNESLTDSQLRAASSYLSAKWSVGNETGCSPVPANCTAARNAVIPDAQIETYTAFSRALDSDPILQQTLVFQWVRMVLGYADAYTERCAALVNGTYVWPVARPSAAAKATLTAYGKAWSQLVIGLEKQLGICAVSTDPIARKIYSAWKQVSHSQS